MDKGSEQSNPSPSDQPQEQKQQSHSVGDATSSSATPDATVTPTAPTAPTTPIDPLFFISLVALTSLQMMQKAQMLQTSQSTRSAGSLSDPYSSAAATEGKQEAKKERKEKERKEKEPPAKFTKAFPSSLPPLLELESDERDDEYFSMEQHNLMLREKPSLLMQACKTKTEEDICDLFARQGARAKSAEEHAQIISLALDKNYSILTSLLIDHPFEAKSKSSKTSASSSSFSSSSSSSADHDSGSVRLGRGFDANHDLVVALSHSASPERIQTLLLRHHANPNFKTIDGEAIITLAAKSAGEKVMRILIAAKADVGATNQQGDTALIITAAQDNEMVLKALLDPTLAKVGDIKLAHRNHLGKNAYQAAMCEDNEGCLALLCDYSQAHGIKVELNDDVEALLKEDLITCFMANELIKKASEWGITSAVVAILKSIVQAEARRLKIGAYAQSEPSPDLAPSASLSSSSGGRGGSHGSRDADDDDQGDRKGTLLRRSSPSPTFDSKTYGTFSGGGGGSTGSAESDEYYSFDAASGHVLPPLRLSDADGFRNPASSLLQAIKLSSSEQRPLNLFLEGRRPQTKQEHSEILLLAGKKGFTVLESMLLADNPFGENAAPHATAPSSLSTSLSLTSSSSRGSSIFSSSQPPSVSSNTTPNAPASHWSSLSPALLSTPSSSPSMPPSQQNPSATDLSVASASSSASSSSSSSSSFSPSSG